MAFTPLASSFLKATSASLKAASASRACIRSETAVFAKSPSHTFVCRRWWHKLSYCRRHFKGSCSVEDITASVSVEIRQLRSWLTAARMLLLPPRSWMWPLSAHLQAVTSNICRVGIVVSYHHVGKMFDHLFIVV